MFDHLWIYTWTISFCVIPRIIRRKDHLSIDLVDSSCQTDNGIFQFTGMQNQIKLSFRKCLFSLGLKFELSRICIRITSRLDISNMIICYAIDFKAMQTTLVKV